MGADTRSAVRTVLRYVCCASFRSLDQSPGGYWKKGGRSPDRRGTQKGKLSPEPASEILNFREGGFTRSWAKCAESPPKMENHAWTRMAAERKNKQPSSRTNLGQGSLGCISLRSLPLSSCAIVAAVFHTPRNDHQNCSSGARARGTLRSWAGIFLLSLPAGALSLERASASVLSSAGRCPQQNFQPNRHFRQLISRVIFVRLLLPLRFRTPAKEDMLSPAKANPCLRKRRPQVNKLT